MKETPIIMSGNHPKLILDGIKTQSRRVIKPQPQPCNHQKVFGDKDPQAQKPTVFYQMRSGHWACMVCGKGIKQDPKSNNPFDYIGIKCPYGQVGDLLWVRETWATEWMLNDFKPSELPKYSPYNPDALLPIAFTNTDWDGYRVGKTRPSIFLPKCHSRITLEITELWAEMLRSISPADAIAEGGYTVEEFIKLYLKINHLPDDADPWNWAIKYKLLGD